MKRYWNSIFSPLRHPEPEPGGGGGAPPAPAAAAPAAPTPTPPPAFNPDGTFSENWTAALGDEFTAHADALKNFKDVKGLAKSFLHFRSTGPAYPGEGASTEDVTRFRGLAQVPAEASAVAYGLEIPETATDADKAAIDRLAKVAHANHMPAPAMKAIFAEWNTIQQEQLQALNDEWTAKQKASQDALIADWRGNYEANKSTVRHLATTLASQAGIDPQDATFADMVNNPAFARMMLEVSKLTQEDRITTPTGFGDLRSPQQRADAILNGSDPIWGKKYTEGTHEERMAAYKEVTRLLNSAT